MICDHFILMLVKQLILILFLKYMLFVYGCEINIKPRLLRFIKYNKKMMMNNNIEAYLNSIKEYIDLINQKKLKAIKYNCEIINPKISFISPVFNKEKYLNSLILSIQYQYLSDFEIIFIDDCSSDRSINIINKFSKIDSRIKLIKNKRNKGTLYSRSQGALLSKGEYIIFIDSDDLILRDGLYNSYNYIKNNDLSMVQFNTIFKRNDSLSLSIRYYKYEKVIVQPILSYIFYYNEATMKGDELNTALWDKLVKRETVIKAMNFIGKDYYNEIIRIENDVILLFSIFKMADSYQYINETGYFYIRTNNDSITNIWSQPKISKSVIHGIFVNIKFLYEKTGNSILDKMLCVFKLKQSFKRYIICFANAENEYYFMKNVLKLLLNSPYILKDDKTIISYIDLSISLIYLGINSNKK